MKKILSMLTTVITAVIMLLGMAGCGWRDRMYSEYESGYFKYAVGTYKNGKQDAFLMGLTELGKQQTELILPEEIEGIPIKGLGYQIGQGWYSVEGRAKIESDKLKKIYIIFSINDWDRRHGDIGANISIVQWRGDEIWNMGGGKKIIGYNILKDCFDRLVTTFNKLVSNVVYLKNDEETADDGYYWVDSYDKGLIEYIPPEPTREGFMFAGWYKEAECLTKWDFATDKTGEEIPIIDDSNIEDYDDSGITYLYAKWEKE